MKMTSKEVKDWVKATYLNKREKPNKNLKKATCELLEPQWCQWCDKPARYEAEAWNGSSVYVCSYKPHSKSLTGPWNMRLIKKLKPRNCN